MAVTRGRRPKDLYEDWADNLDTLWSIGSWIQEEAEQQKNKNKQKKKSSEINVSTISSSVANDKFKAIGNSVDSIGDKIKILEKISIKFKKYWKNLKNI